MKLYVYDSCPFCTRVRAVLGIKIIPFQLEFLSAGQFPEELASRLITNTVPILEMEGNESKTSIIMQESLDIIDFLDRSVEPALFSNYNVNNDVLTTVKEISISSLPLCYPRMPFLDLPELQASQARNYFQKSREERMKTSFFYALNNTSEYVRIIGSALNTLAFNYQVEDLINDMRNIEIEDVIIFSELRNLTMIKELQFPESLAAFVEMMAEKTGVKLFQPIDKLGGAE